jgi:hypothetical protein
MFEIHYKDQIRNIECNKDASEYTTHICNSSHFLGEVEGLGRKLRTLQKKVKINILGNLCIYTAEEGDKLILEHKAEDYFFHLTWPLYKKDLSLSKSKHYLALFICPLPYGAVVPLDQVGATVTDCVV